jgi:hypothetical protein
VGLVAVVLILVLVVPHLHRGKEIMLAQEVQAHLVMAAVAVGAHLRLELMEHRLLAAMAVLEPHRQ